MKATYNKSKIMRNAWFLKKIQPSMTFAACLRKAWRNEKLHIVQRIAEGLPIDEPAASTYRPESLVVPQDYYGVRGAYYGD